MAQPLANKNHLIYVGVIALLLCGGILITPLYVNGTEWKDSIAYAGSAASIIGIVTIIMQTYGVSRAAEAINEAVKENNNAISRIMTLDDISKHLQMLQVIDAYLTQNRWDAAHLRLYEMQFVLEEISSKIAIYQISKSVMDACLSDIRTDLRNLNRAIHNNASVDSGIIADHIDSIGPILHKVKAYLTNPQQ